MPKLTSSLIIPTSGSAVQLEPVGFSAAAGFQDLRVRNFTTSGTATFGSTATAQTVFAAANGSAAAPSYTFTNSTTTGLYRVGADSLGIAVAGVAHWSISSAGLQGLNAASLLTWTTGLGAINHVTGPTDQPLVVLAGLTAGTTGNALNAYAGTGASGANAGGALNLSGGLAGNAATAGGAINFQVALAASGTTRTTAWSVANTGNFVAGTDNAYSIGGSATTFRPSSVYAATSMVIANANTITGTAVTGSGAMTVQATAATLSLVATAANVITMTTNGTEALRATSSQQVGVNTSTVSGGIVGKLHVADGSGSVVCTIQEAHATQEPVFLLRRSRGTLAAPTIVANGDCAAMWYTQAYDGTAFQDVARIRVEMDGAVAANDLPGRIMFLTTPSGAAVPTEKWRVTNAGSLSGQNAGSILTWTTGLGAINHVTGPTDQPLAVTSGSTRALNLTATSATLALAATGANTITLATNATTAWTITSGQNLQGNAAGSILTWGTGLGAISHVTGPSDQALKIATASNQNISLAPNGTGVVAVASALTTTGKITNYNSVATAGWGVGAIYASGRSTAQTAAVASIAAYTVGAADGSFEVNFNVDVTASTTHSFTLQVDYTDEDNTARSVALPVWSRAGAAFLASGQITNAEGVGIYYGVTLRLRCKASTSITCKTAGTFTSVTYNVEAMIAQVA